MIKYFSFLFLFFIIVCLPARQARAVTSFVPVSNIGLSGSVNITCDTGDKVLEYDPSDHFVVVHNCGSYFGASGVVAGVYNFIECKSSVGGAVCSASDTTLSSALSDAGYISGSSFIFSDSFLGTCSAYYICYYDWLNVQLVIIFLLAILVMGYFINFFKSTLS